MKIIPWWKRIEEQASVAECMDAMNAEIRESLAAASSPSSATPHRVSLEISEREVAQRTLHAMGMDVPKGLSKTAQSLTDDLMDCIDRLGSEAETVDPRVWDHLRVYMPAQPVEQHNPTGWVAAKDQPAVPVLFNPYTGEPRDVRDVTSDPHGVLIVPSGKVEMLAAQKQRSNFGGPEMQDLILAKLTLPVEQPLELPLVDELMALSDAYVGTVNAADRYARLDARAALRIAIEQAIRSKQDGTQTNRHVPIKALPFGGIRKAAMAIYQPPFRTAHGYIYDAQNHMVADQGGSGKFNTVEGAVAAQVRGWGRIGYMPNAAALQDEVAELIADALTAYYEQCNSQPIDLGVVTGTQS